MSRNIRTLGRVAYDERRVEHIHTKVQGWVERLFVEYEGEMVGAEAVARELASRNITVNAVAPGWTVTPMIADKGLDDDHVARATATMSLKKPTAPWLRAEGTASSTSSTPW